MLLISFMSIFFCSRKNYNKLKLTYVLREMATIQKNLEMVNFVCKFGDADLLDLFDEVVYPAFF